MKYSSYSFLLVLHSMFTPIALANEAETNWLCVSTIAGSHIRWIGTALGQQKTVTVQSSSLREEPILVVFLHADSPFGDPVYQYDLARKIAEIGENTIAVSILRPGYRDSCGDQSGGTVGKKMGDNYTIEVVESLAKVMSRIP